MKHTSLKIMVEYGLTVSLNASPRTPRTPIQHLMELDYVDFDALVVRGGAPRKQTSSDDHQHPHSVSSSISISPRVLFSGAAGTGRSSDYPRQRLDFSSFDLAEELSPVSFTGYSAILSASLPPVVMAGGAPDFQRDMKREKCDDNCRCHSSVGECNVCYSELPSRANHIFTICGHLFCVKCLLKWWDTATTCPVCRAEIFETDDANDESVGDDVGGELDNGSQGSVNGAAEDGGDGGIWMRREFWNGRVNNFESSDDEDVNPNIQQYNGNDVPIRNLHNDNNNNGAPDNNNGALDDNNNNGAPDNNNNNNNGAPDNNNNNNGAPDNNNDNNDRDHDDDYDYDIGVNNQDNITLINRYLYQDNHHYWTGHNDVYASDPFIDDTVYFVTHYELQGLRENREIAMTLFARMRFNDTLFDANTQFLGEVWSGIWVPKNSWVSLNRHQDYLVSNRNVMYEFVIRRNSNISPFYEVSVFGFIKDVMIQEMVEYSAINGHDYDDNWENLMDYAFIADVFTPTDFSIRDRFGNENILQSYGNYNMNDGTIVTQEVMISFSQIRRLYRMSGHVSVDA